MMSLSTLWLIEELTSRNYKVDIISKRDNIFCVSWKTIKNKLCKSADLGLNCYLWVRFADNKSLLSSLSDYYNFVYPYSYLVEEWVAIDFDIVEKKVRYPVVVKPYDWAHWKGIQTFLKTREQVELAIMFAFKYSKKVLIQSFVVWDDHRLLVLDWKFYAAVKRTAACVFWDGKLTIWELVEIENENPLRWSAKFHEKLLVKIILDEISDLFLERKYWYTTASVPKKWEKVQLKPMANVSSGWTLEDVTNEICYDMKEFVEYIARIVDLKIVGIDILTIDCSKPLSESWGAMIELNANPALYVHDWGFLWVDWFGSYWVFEKIVDMFEEKYS